MQPLAVPVELVGEGIQLKIVKQFLVLRIEHFDECRRVLKLTGQLRKFLSNDDRFPKIEEKGHDELIARMH